MAAALIWMASYVYVPILPAYAISLGASAVTVGLISGSYGVLQMILRIPIGFMTDRIKKDRAFLIVGFSLLVISALLFLIPTKDPMTLIWGRGISGAASAWWVIISASYAKYQKEDAQVKAQGKLQIFANGGKIVASLLCALTAQVLGYTAVFIFSLIIAAVGMTLMFGLKDKKEPENAPVIPLKNQFALFKNRDVIVFSILAILSQLIAFATATTFTPVAAEDLGADSFMLGILIMVFFLFTSVSAAFVGTEVYKKLGCANTTAISFIIGAISCLPALYHINIPMIFVTEALAGICYGITQSITAGFIIRSVPPEQRGAATGIFQFLYTVGILFGPIAMGYIIEDVSFDAAYWIMTGMMLLSAALCYVLIPKEYKRLT